MEYSFDFGLYIINIDCQTSIYTRHGVMNCKPNKIYYIDPLVSFQIAGRVGAGQIVLVQTPVTEDRPQNLNQNGIAQVCDDLGICQQFYEVFRQVPQDQLYYMEMRHAFAQVIHHHYMSQTGALIGPSVHCPVIEKAIIYIHQHLEEKIHIATIARHLDVSSSYLSHRFKEIMDMTISTYIQHARIKKARYLLTYRQLTVAEVANTLGYKDISWFIKVFTKIEGIHPKHVLTTIHQPSATLDIN